MLTNRHRFTNIYLTWVKCHLFNKVNNTIKNMKPTDAIKTLEEMDAQIIDALRSAVRELQRIDTVKDGHPLVSHGLMCNLVNTLGEVSLLQQGK
jgi:hypothetical protein